VQPVPDQQQPPADQQPSLDRRLLAEVERTAVELARLAGAEIQAALGRVLAVRYKGATAGDALAEVVSVRRIARLQQRS
jgi:hypothetical protein